MTDSEGFDLWRAKLADARSKDFALESYCWEIAHDSASKPGEDEVNYLTR